MSRGSSGGGSSPTIQSSTIKEHSLPDYAKPYFEELLGRSAYEATRPYETYGAQRLADFDPYETTAMQGMQTMAAAGTPSQFATGSTIASGVGNQAAPGSIANPETLQNYMNPYQQLVTDVEKREATRQSDIMGSQIGQQAAQTGGMGGYREAIMQSERERNLGQQLGDIQARGGQQAFGQAQQAFEADRAAGMASRGQQLDAARTLGAFGQQQQSMDYERLKNLQAAGQGRRQLGQQGLSMGYQDFQRQQAYPREQLGLFNTMIQGLPVTPGGQLTTYGGPSQAQQLLGTGIGGVGLYNAMNRPT
tara:strand:+ start:924 stop:1841 length:918 start_codon:yes stop_codon:yes gene_type:complete